MNNEAPMGMTSGIRQPRSAQGACRTVYVVDNDMELWAAMSLVLERAHYTVTSFASAKALLATINDRSTGILILDFSLVDMSGLTLQNELKRHGIGLKTIFISGSGTIATSVQAIKAGAIDFIEKPFTEQKLLNSVDEARAVAIADEKRHRQRTLHEKRYEQLTRREREIMNFLIRGDTNQKLAERIGVSKRTIEVHRSNIMRKLEAASLSDLVRMACMHSDIHPEEVLVAISPSL